MDKKLADLFTKIKNVLRAKGENYEKLSAVWKLAEEGERILREGSSDNILQEGGKS